MGKLDFSAPAITLFTVISFIVSASSLATDAAGFRRDSLDIPGVSNTSSTEQCDGGICTCDTLCAQPDAVLAMSCPGVEGLASRVPCGCTSEYSVAYEACARCQLPFSGTQTGLANNIYNTQSEFADFQTACAEASSPIQNIDLRGIQLAILRPMNLTFETPLSMDDPSFPTYVGAVCLRPDRMIASQCFLGLGPIQENWNRCPNQDVAGILVRFSAYLTNLLLGIILMYSPKESSTAVWTQLLTVYSLLISGIISIWNASILRFHSDMTIDLVMSPLSSTLVVYAILGFCGRSHRLDNILSKRREHLLTRLLVISFAIISLALVIFNGIADADHFPPNPCEEDDLGLEGILLNLLFVPYAGVILVVIIVANTPGTDASNTVIGIELAAIGPFALVVISCIYGIVKQRRLLARQFQVENNRWKIWVTWDVLAAQYPFMHFCGVFFVPMIYWILVIEAQLLGTPDNLFSSSFGQILALFVVLPPLLQVLQMAPMAGAWFMNLTVFRVITGRRKAVPPVKAYSLEDGILEKTASVVSAPFILESYQN